jgi:hypothetical protein
VHLASGGVAVRRLSAIECGAWVDDLDGAPVAISGGLPVMRMGYGSLPNWMIELTADVGRMEGPRVNSLYKQLLCAFFLHGYPLAGPGKVFFSSAPQWMAEIRLETPIQIRPRSTGGKELGEESLRAIVETFKRLRACNLDQPANPHDLALHRFLLGGTRESAVDALLDYVISLECILLPYDRDVKHGDLSYRFRLHGARYLGTSFGQRSAISKSLRDLYHIRSRLVHGDNYPEPTDIEDFSRVARDLAASALLKATASHFPRVEEFNDWVLG